jgi:hypothetical protein
MHFGAEAGGAPASALFWFLRFRSGFNFPTSRIIPSVNVVRLCQ